MRWALALVGCLLIGVVHAAPPENADPALAPFFRALKVPGAEHISCCDESDCRTVKTRVAGNVIQIFIDSKIYPGGKDIWMDVPANKILKPRENPTGEAVACWNETLGLICFLDGVKT